MIRHILVPLDGSDLAESVLPCAALLAEKRGAKLLLLHLIERNAPATVHGDRHLTSEAEAKAYLADVAARRLQESRPVETHVHEVEVDSVPAGIADHAAGLNCDLIVLCAHGGTGVRTFLTGRIAQRVIALRETPVLMMQPGTLPDGLTNAPVLAPLDGKPDHEQGLPLAAEIAAACGAPLHLMRVVPTLQTLTDDSSAAGKLLPGTMTALLDLLEGEARAYLAAVVENLAAGVALAASVERGDPVGAILSRAEELHAGLIVLTTHGRRGMGAFWSGSVAPKIALRADTPLLLVKATEG